MKKVDYNIEFAHIYTNENFAEEHYAATKIARDKIKELESQGKTCSATILIDNYNSTDHILDVPKFVEELEEIGVKPDFTMFEADLAKYKDKCLALMNGKLKKQYSKYIESNGKCPCSFLVAVWHLARLGVFKIESSTRNHPTDKPFVGRRIITILPKRYGAIEKKAHDIIKSTPFALELARMENIFF